MIGRALVLAAMLGQGASYPSVVTLVPAGVDLFLLDSTNAANLSGATNAVGVIGENQLIKLARLLEERRHRPVKLVALHHFVNTARDARARRGQRPMGFAGRKLHELAAVIAGPCAPAGLGRRGDPARLTPTTTSTGASTACA
ncbi:MAG: hypothetical protein U0166_13685 [Acidobacteriota bacterium]